jgi:hypothetical protein
VVDLATVPLTGRVALFGDVLTAEVPRRLEPQHIRNRMGVGVEEVLVAQAG